MADDDGYRDQASDEDEQRERLDNLAFIAHEGAAARFGVEMIRIERARQIRDEDWDAEHDDIHRKGELAAAGAVYALPPDLRQRTIWNNPLFRLLWPWEAGSFKPSPRPGIGVSFSDERVGRIHELAKAGALIAAEIDRIARNAE